MSTSLIYDQIPYPGLSYAQTHPDRLATIATLLGLKPAPVERCRVLDIGCAVGGNLVPMAYGLPEGQFVGIDNSGRQIATGRQHVAELDLKNVDLQQVDILDMPIELGQFDFIIAHGIYSWIPEEVRDALLAAIRRHLAPNGVAYLSYNVYPGWHMLNIVRDAMRYRVRGIKDPLKQTAKARALLDLLAQAIPAEKNALGGFLDSYSNSLAAKLAEGENGGDALLLHDELAGINEPVYFYQFAEHASQHGLQYLSEVEFDKVMPSQFPSEVAKQLQEISSSSIDIEQYLDFLRNNTFRKSLLCHQEIKINRTLRPDVVQRFHLASRARPVSNEVEVQDVSVEKFRGPDGAVFSTDHPLSKAAMLILAKETPKPVPFKRLLAEAADLADLSSEADMQTQALALGANVLRAYSYSGSLVELHLYLPEFVTEVSDRPLTSPVARWQAGQGLKVTNMRHERVEIDDTARHILLQLDGQNTRGDLLLSLVALHKNGFLVLTENQKTAAGGTEILELLAKELDENLGFLARAALLVA